jgi:hypothetical protein
VNKTQNADGYAHLSADQRRERITRRNRLFEEWLKDNPGGTFEDYYGQVIERHLDSGESHPTLGRKLIPGRAFGEGGDGMLKRLTALGLEKQHTIVDFGCGSLRIGWHFIRHLDVGRYWGLDVNERFLRDGEAMIGAELMAEKTPHLRVIDDSSLADAHAAEPDFLFSKSVLLHVHPDELKTYFERIFTIANDHTQVIVDATLSSKQVQFEPLSWAYQRAEIETIVAGFGWSASALSSKPVRLEAADSDGEISTLLITRAPST